ncbi:MAG: hypothetical protein JNM19_12970 [Chitinophagaceae bacterium]|nr:hypothetical protein [Chitinophagaceae bacterium]
MKKLVPGNLVKWLFITIIIFQSLFLGAQESKRFDITLKYSPLPEGPSQVRLDSVLVKSGNRKEAIWYSNASTSDSIFIIPGLALGKYRVFPSANGFMVFPQTVFVCSGCEKKIDFTAMLSKEKFANQIFDFVEISPSYIGGQKAMTSFFQRILSETEMQQISDTPDFSVHFFVTKEKEISDITIYPATIDPRTQAIVVKAINALSNWQVGISNGRKSDGEVSFSKSLFTPL